MPVACPALPPASPNAAETTSALAEALPSTPTAERYAASISPAEAPFLWAAAASASMAARYSPARWMSCSEPSRAPLKKPATLILRRASPSAVETLVASFSFPAKSVSLSKLLAFSWLIIPLFLSMETGRVPAATQSSGNRELERSTGISKSRPASEAGGRNPSAEQKDAPPRKHGGASRQCPCHRGLKSRNSSIPS